MRGKAFNIHNEANAFTLSLTFQSAFSLKKDYNKKNHSTKHVPLFTKKNQFKTKFLKSPIDTNQL